MADTASPPAMVNTKTAERRELRYQSLDDLLRDLDAIESSHSAGTLRTTGNWTTGQIAQHCAILMRCAIDGFPTTAPWLVRVIVTALFKKKALSGAPAPPGFKIPKQAGFLTPDDDVTFEQGVGELREVVGRIKAGERFTHPSPVFGRLSHEEWTTLQLGHTAMHMSFVWPS